MPLGVLQTLRDVLPTAAAHHSAYAELLSSPWAPAHKVPRQSHLPPHTSFEGKEAQIHTCQEGYRCVSRVGRFGTGHDEQIDKDKVRVAQKTNVGADVDAEGKSTGGTAQEYEWNCPVKGKSWAQDRFESGDKPEQCRAEKDCICIFRGAEDSQTELKDGLEKRHEQVDAEIGCGGGGKSQKMQLTIIPHYQIRKIREKFDPEDTNSDMGDIVELSQDAWIDKYKSGAPKLQASLDSLKKYVADTYEEKVREKDYVCGPPGEMVPGQVRSMTEEEVHEASVKIRNFQILSKDCEQMRDTVPMLVSPTSEKVSPPGHKFLGVTKQHKKLNCYRLKGGEACVQLNCYTGHDDTMFQNHLREFEAKMMACEPEPEDVGVPPGTPTVASATTPNAAEGTGVVAGGDQPPEAPAAQPETPEANGSEAAPPAQQGVGPGGVALAVLLGRQVSSSASKRKSWQRFL